MEVRRILIHVINHLSSLERGDELLECFLKKLVQNMLDWGIKDDKILKEISIYRLEKDPASARHLLSVIRSSLSCEFLKKILALIRPLNVDEDTFLEAASLIRSVCKDEYSGLRNSVRLAASYILANKSSIITPKDVRDAAAEIGDPEAYRAAIRVIRGDRESLLTQVVSPEPLFNLPEEKIPYGYILRLFSTLSTLNKGFYTRLSGPDKKSMKKALSRFQREFEAAGRNTRVGSYLDRLRVMARLYEGSFLREPYPSFLLELERLLMTVLKSSSSDVFKNMRNSVRSIVEKASKLGVMLTSHEIISHTFVPPLEDIVIGIRYRGRELGRPIVRLISLLVPDLKEMTYLSDGFPDALFAINSLYPEEIYVGRYIHVGIEAYVFDRDDMIKTKERIFKKTLSNLVEKFKDSNDRVSQAKASARAVSLAEGRAYVWGLVPHLVNKRESSSLYQLLNPIIKNIEDRLVRLYAFMRALWAGYEGMLHYTIISGGRENRNPIRNLIVQNLEDVSDIILASIHTVSEVDDKILRLLAFSTSFRLLDALTAMIRLSSVVRVRRSIFYRFHDIVRRLFEESVPLVEEGLKSLDVFKVVNYPTFNPIFSVVIRRYQIVEALQRAAIFMHLYGLEDVLPKVREFVDERTLTAMEPRIFDYDPDVLAVYLPISGGKMFKLHRYSKGI